MTAHPRSGASDSGSTPAAGSDQGAPQGAAQLARFTQRNRWGVRDGAVDLHRPSLPERSVRLRAQPADVDLDPTRTALIVIDMQNDFCAPTGWLSGMGLDGSVLLPAVECAAQAVRAARQAEAPVVWLNWGNRPDLANIPPGVAHAFDPAGRGEGLGSLVPGTDSRVLTKGSWGAELMDGLAAQPEDIWIDKYRMSGFWDTPLDSVLRNLRVDTLLFAGVNSDQCVYATLIDAACIGYDVIMLTDASATTSPTFCHDATLHNIRQCYGFTASTADLVSALR